MQLKVISDCDCNSKKVYNHKSINYFKKKATREGGPIMKNKQNKSLLILHLTNNMPKH